ncbi:hypothetical protein PIB30_096954 [Stylosanthes scabra]|uniref:Uncharacterized protein n=1 Tax=Stylosanthes scabra TaxID=79078 RepID=A0ABU6TWS3_9FABA|nr:hypothetical protein [Stylosanthes scabra]
MVGLTRKFSLSHLWSPPICIFELRREMRLTMDGAAEEDYVIKAVGTFDRLPFQAAEDMTHFLWVYAELFTRLGVWFPFTDFQRDVMTRCRVEASQLHLNGCTLLPPEGVYVLPCSARVEAF